MAKADRSRAGGAARRSRFKRRRTPVGASPGTLIADPAAERSVLTLTLIGPDRHRTVADADLDKVARQRGRWPVVWLDCSGLADIALIGEIGRMFGLHPLALEDVVNTGQRPKVDFFDDHAFVTVNAIVDAAQHRYEQVSIFFGADFVVTFQERAGDPFAPVAKRIAAPLPNGLRERGADYLAYALIDAVADGYFQPVEQASDIVERIEDEMLNAPQSGQMQELHALRRGTNALKGALWPLRDALASLIRNDAPYVKAETKLFLNDTLDHAIRLIELVEMQRDAMTGLIEMHLSLSQARTNDIISLLTIVSTIFIPLTFLVGVWGMNFDPDISPWNMPELRAYYGYPAAMLFMAAVAVALFVYFKWKKWL